MSDDSNPDVEQEARLMGWLPEEEFKGDKSHWVDAEEYVSKGRQVMPILLANNKRLQRELLTRDGKIDTLAQQLDGATKAIEKLEQHYSAANKRAVEVAKEQLKEELKQARSDEDVDAELAIMDKLEQLRQTPEPEKKVVPPTKDNTGLDPEFVEWQADNQWFNEDKKKTKLVVRIAEDLREEGDTTKGRAFYDKCVAEYERQYGDSNDTQDDDGRSTSKVAPNSRGGRRSSAAKGYDALPADAKQACLEDADALVGPNKRYKSLSDWQKKYAEIYFAEGN